MHYWWVPESKSSCFHTITSIENWIKFLLRSQIEYSFYRNILIWLDILRSPFDLKQLLRTFNSRENIYVTLQKEWLFSFKNILIFMVSYYFFTITKPRSTLVQGQRYLKVLKKQLNLFLTHSPRLKKIPNSSCLLCWLNPLLCIHNGLYNKFP